MLLEHDDTPRRELRNDERFVPAQREKAFRQLCPRCGAGPKKPCVFVDRADRKGRAMTVLHIERYPTHA
jgi:hypothetical protein